MKIYKLFFICYLLMGQITHAQISEFGLYGGLAATHISGVPGGFGKVGVDLGAFARKNYSEKLDLRAGLGFVQKGNQTGSIDNPNSFDRIALNYLEIPLSIEYDQPTFFALGGLGLGVLLSHNEEDGSGLINNVLNARRIELSIHAGAGIHIGDNARVVVKYTSSLLPVSDNVVVAPIGIFGVFGGAFNQVVSVCFEFALSKNE